MARGGRRAGRPGEKYPNRSDLATAPRTAPVVAISGQGYGDQAAQTNAARAVNQAGAARAATNPPPQPPDIMGRLNAPTERPDEPFQTGLPTGPGAGPEILGVGSTPSMDLGAWLRQNPYDQDVADIIEILRSMGR